MWLLWREMCHSVGLLAGYVGRGKVHLAHVVLGQIVGLRDALRIEGVGRYDIGTGFQIFAVNLSQGVGASQGNHIVVAL